MIVHVTNDSLQVEWKSKAACLHQPDLSLSTLFTNVRDLDAKSQRGGENCVSWLYSGLDGIPKETKRQPFTQGLDEVVESIQVSPARHD